MRISLLGFLTQTISLFQCWLFYTGETYLKEQETFFLTLTSEMNVYRGGVGWREVSKCIWRDEILNLSIHRRAILF